MSWRTKIGQNIKTMASPATNLTTVVADSVSVRSPALRETWDLHDIFVGVGAVTEPATVSVPNADAVETELRYTPAPGHVPALDGVVNYIAQETAKPGIVNKYYTTNRKHYHFIETYSPLIYKKIMGQVASARSECVHRVMCSRPAYYCELEELRRYGQA